MSNDFPDLVDLEKRIIRIDPGALRDKTVHTVYRLEPGKEYMMIFDTQHYYDDLITFEHSITDMVKFTKGKHIPGNSPRELHSPPKRKRW